MSVRRLQVCDVVGCEVEDSARGTGITAFAFLLPSEEAMPEGWGRVRVTEHGVVRTVELCPVHTAALVGGQVRGCWPLRRKP
jgi:hypothetical protein